MIFTFENFAVFTFAVVLTLLCRAYIRWRKIVAVTPPGPAPLPFIGNLLDIPTRTPGKTYAAWGRDYGSDLISVRALAGSLTVVVNTAKAAREIFEKRAFNYSDRPHYAMVDLMGWDFNLGLMPYGNRWRTSRRMMHQFMHANVTKAYHPLLAFKTRALLDNLQRDPDAFLESLSQYATSIAMSIAYAYDVRPGYDQYVAISQKAAAQVSGALFPGAMIVNAFPALARLPSWFPGTGFHAYAKEARLYTTLMREAPLAYVQKEMSAGMAKPSMALTMIEANEASGGGEEGMRYVKDVTAIAYIAGSDTTLSTITTFVLAMVLHPTIQRRAQAELDAVVGRDRLPTFDDRAALPYVGAVCREVLRWKPVTPLGLARRAMYDDEYDGYLIPAGSTVHYNTWGILHDPDVYHNPESFKPERFLNADGSLNADDVSPAFGFGRRICVGIHLARASLWNAVVSILATLDVTKAKDMHGNEIPVEVDYSNIVISHAKPFKCSIVPRDAKAAALIHEPDVPV
ncbi:cytochrome P450 [Amylostereum chailletii]|nr:cytochrome P450 [Amylostereum chailletii]